MSQLPIPQRPPSRKVSQTALPTLLKQCARHLILLETVTGVQTSTCVANGTACPTTDTSAMPTAINVQCAYGVTPECPTGMHCVAGECQPNLHGQPCRYLDDCPPTHRCDMSECQPHLKLSHGTAYIQASYCMGIYCDAPCTVNSIAADHCTHQDHEGRTTSWRYSCNQSTVTFDTFGQGDCESSRRISTKAFKVRRPMMLPSTLTCCFSRAATSHAAVFWTVAAHANVSHITRYYMRTVPTVS